MAGLNLAAVSKHFGATVAVDRVSLAVADGEFLALLGPSGCGKTTILRMVAGFERVTHGEIAFDDTVVSGPQTHLPPERRRVGIVFQSYALWPHMTVGRNVGYPLQVAGLRGAAYRDRVAAALATVGMSELAERRPADLSGGQRQRVALARCLVMEPSLMLLDEPLANLDVHLRAAMEAEFVAFHEKTQATMVYITHDQAEAMAMADRIAVMADGQLEQVADPKTLYSEPATQMVADFIGRGVVADAIVHGAPNGGRCTIDLFGCRIAARCQADQALGPATVCLRPEDIAPAGNGAEDTIVSTVRRVTYKGGASLVEVAPDGASNATLLLDLPEAPAVGESLHLSVHDGWVIPG